MLITIKKCVAALLVVSFYMSNGYAAAGNANKVQQSFTPPEVAADETNVFVIRESGFVGGARGAWIAANNNVVADLSNGSHVMIKLKSGLNVIHGVQGLAGFGFVPVDNRPGETVYLNLAYTKGEMNEITAEAALPLINKTKQIELLPEVRPNTALDDITVNPGRLGFKIMEASDAILEPDDKSAVITFFRSEKLIKAIPFDLWDDSGYVGSLKGGYYFDLRVAPGAHTFISKSEHYAVLKADVAAGKHYYVELEVDLGWNQAHIKILPMDLVKDAMKINGLKKLTCTALSASMLENAVVKPRIQAGNSYLADVRQKIADGKLPTRELLATQGR
jgi:hypothetical protein